MYNNNEVPQVPQVPQVPAPPPPLLATPLLDQVLAAVTRTRNWCGSDNTPNTLVVSVEMWGRLHDELPGFTGRLDKPGPLVLFGCHVSVTAVETYRMFCVSDGEISALFEFVL